MIRQSRRFFSLCLLLPPLLLLQAEARAATSVFALLGENGQETASEINSLHDQIAQGKNRRWYRELRNTKFLAKRRQLETVLLKNDYRCVLGGLLGPKRPVCAVYRKDEGKLRIEINLPSLWIPISNPGYAPFQAQIFVHSAGVAHPMDTFIDAFGRPVHRQMEDWVKVDFKTMQSLANALGINKRGEIRSSTNLLEQFTAQHKATGVIRPDFVIDYCTEGLPGTTGPSLSCRYLVTLNGKLTKVSRIY